MRQPRVEVLFIDDCPNYAVARALVDRAAGVASSESAERWIAGRPEVAARLISIPTAIAAGRAVFGNVFDGA